MNTRNTNENSINNEISAILNKVYLNESLTKEDAIKLLNVDVYSKEMYSILSCANELSRKHFNNTGVIFAQVGLNNSLCSKNCDFCFFGEKHRLVSQNVEYTDEQILDKVNELVKSEVTEIFLMATADYDFEKFLSVGRKVKKLLPNEMKFVANIGDFDRDMAKELEKAGFTGVYHICRLGEGKTTDINKEKRLSTLSVIKDSNLDLYYCIEPIGPEHTNEEIATEMFRGLEYDVAVMAVMRRIPVAGTPLENSGQISELQLSKICAVTRLVMGDSIRAMGVHEPSLLSLIAGANQIYAEKGCNPRDHKEETSKGRGFSSLQAKKMLWESGWKL